MKFLSESGYFLDHQTAAGQVVIGGACPLPGAISPNTGVALTQFAQVRLDPEAFWIPDWGRADIHFLYSWTCGICESDFSYQYVDGGLKVLEFGSGNEGFDGFPYEDYPLLFDPVSFALKKISEADRLVILELNKEECTSEYRFSTRRIEQLSVPTHQFGGVPYLFAPGFAKDCVVCGQEMPVVASIGNGSYSTVEGFCGNDFVQIVYWACIECKVVSALNFSS